MEFMVTIKFPDGSPNAYFFSDAPTANRFYYSKCDTYSKGSLLEGTKVQLWRMSHSGIRYDLKLSND